MKILFFDTETTGLPKDWNAPLSDLKNWPRLVQLAWQVYDQHQNLIEENDFIIKPNGFTIPLEASNVHKITTQKANKTGEDLDKVLRLFCNSVIESNLLVAHNYNYDYSIMGSELLRNGKENCLKEKENICTMKASTAFCKIPGPYGNKWPKLEELYDKLFNETFNTHNALDDIKATSKCFWELISKKLITLNYEFQNKVLLKINNIGNKESNIFKDTCLFKYSSKISENWSNQLYLIVYQRRKFKIRGWNFIRNIHSTIIINETEVDYYREKNNLKGKIYIKDQLKPFSEKWFVFNVFNTDTYTGMLHNDDGSLGGSGIRNINKFPGMKKDGKQIYRRYIFDNSGEKEDEIILYNNYQEVDEWIIEDLGGFSLQVNLSPEFRVYNDGNRKVDQELFPNSGLSLLNNDIMSALNYYILLGISTPFIWFFKGVCAYKNSFLDKAIKYYNYALNELKNNNDYAYYESLDFSYHNKNSGFLIKETALNDLGNITFHQKKYNESLEYYGKCIESFPEFEINKTMNRLVLINSYYFWAFCIFKLSVKTYVLPEEILKGIVYLKKTERIIKHFEKVNPSNQYQNEYHYRNQISLKDINKLLSFLEEKIKENKF